MASSKKSVARAALPIKSIETVDGTKVLGRVLLKDGKSFTVIKGDKIILVRRKKMIQPK